MKSATRKEWKIKRMPRKRAQLFPNRTFSQDEMDLIKRGLIPEEMEQKWFIFFERNRLYFHRSWTGYCIYIAHFEKQSSGYLLSRAEVNRDAKQYDEADDAYDVRILLFLIDHGLLTREVPFPMKIEKFDDDEEHEGESPERPEAHEPGAEAMPPLNADLLTVEEKAIEGGIGMLVAAKRLGLIYLASAPAMEKLLRDHAKEVVDLFEISQQRNLSCSELCDQVDEVTQRLAKVLRGEDTRYMATAWFTDRNQLRRRLYDEFYSVLGDDPELSGWKADPIREQASCFLEGVVQILEAATDTTPKEQVLQEFNDHIRRNVACFLGIPEPLCQYPSQTSGAQSENSTKVAAPND